MKNKIITGIIVLAAVTFISGAALLAMATPGTAEDPFIVMSYLNDIFRPRVTADINKAVSDMTTVFNKQIAQYESQDGTGFIPDDHSVTDVFKVVTLSNGQSLTCSVGTEIMLRIGTAAGFGTAPALVNYTTGMTLSSGTALTTNHMYLITIEGNGITATANTVRVLVRGNCTIS